VEKIVAIHHPPLKLQLPIVSFLSQWISDAIYCIIIVLYLLYYDYAIYYNIIVLYCIIDAICCIIHNYKYL